MRKFFYTVLILIGGLYNVQAQLANGTIAPPFNLEDLNNNIHDLYGDYLDNDIDVILDFSATWCGPCWSYHNSGALENMYTAYGPNGTGDVMVFFIEADLNTNEACLYGPSGCVGGTQGNWVSGTAFPIINLTSTNGPGTGGAYGISYYPTTYVISSRNKKVYEPSIQPPQSLLTSWIFESFAMEATPVITNANCGGDGSIELNVVAGFGTKSFIWSNGSTSQNIYNLDPGYYSVTVTDARGYDIAVEDIEVAGIFAPLFGNVTATNNPSCFGLSDGSITVDGLFGNGNYTYNWSNGATTATVSSIPAGTYGYTITDGGGCRYEDEATIYDPAPISAAVSAPAIPCGQSTGTITITASGGAGNFLYDIGFGTQS